MKKKVIKLENLPAKAPAPLTLSTAIALDFWNAPGWLWGALGLLFIMIWGAAIYKMVKEKPVDIFEDGKNNN